MARPKLGEGDTERLHMKLSADEIEAIDDWRYKNRVPSRSEAVRRLCQMALHADPVFLDLMQMLTTDFDFNADPQIRKQTYLSAAQAWVSWKVLKQGESLDEAQDTIEMMNRLVTAKRGQSK